MKRLTVIIALSAILIFAFSAVANTSNASGNAISVDKSANQIQKPGKAGISKINADDPVLFEDDFEDLEMHWVPAANWGAIDSPNGREFDPETNWKLTDTNANSGAYSWNAVEGNSEVDILLSPVITLPTEVQIGDLVSPLKGLRIKHALDVDTPDGAETGNPLTGESWQYVVGPSETYWERTADAASAGAFGYHLDPTHVPTDLFWRQYMVTGEIDLSGATAAALTFKHDYQSEVEFDYYAVDVSTDDFISYTNVGHWDGAPSGWVEENIDLSAFAGQVIKIRFISYGDYGTAEGYWNIDEISVTADGAEVFADGAEEGDPGLVWWGWTAGHTATGGYFQETYSTTPAPNPNWTEYGPFDVDGFNEDWGPGDDIQVGVKWNSDDDDPQGRGLFIDDFVVYGVGLLPKDLGLFGVKGLLQAKVGMPFTIQVGVANEGLDPLSGNVIWTGTIKNDMDETVHVLTSAPTPIANFPRDTVAWIPTVPLRAWMNPEPGWYTLQVKVIFADGDAANQEATYDLWVPGGPWETVLYRCDFEPYAGESSLEDFGWTVVNGGGNALLGTNDNTWEWTPGFIYGAGALLSADWAWGHMNSGPDMDAVLDSSEVLDESIVSPVIDLSGLGKHNTLGLQYYLYHRPEPNWADPRSRQGWNYVNIDVSVDGGTTWMNVFHFADEDSGYNEPFSRLPHMFFGGSPMLGFTTITDLDITPALRAAKMAGTDMLQIRFNVKNQDSWHAGTNVDEILVYGGISKPMIKAVVDIPADQGGKVGMAFRASANDMVYEWPDEPIGDVVGLPVTRYDIFRLDPMPGATLTASYSSLEAFLDAVAEPSKEAVYYVEDHHMVATYLQSIPATDMKAYGAVLPTLADGVEAAYFVVARTENVLVWSVSEPKAGMSADNLAPSAPTALLVSTTEAGGNSLQWEEAYTPVDDVNYYTIYRSTQSGQYSEALATTTDLMYQDNNVEVGQSYYYVVTATDFAGNESEKSQEGTVVTSVDKKSAVPTDYALNQNYPNPFNPTTTVEYALPKAGEVTITVYNTAGQAIQTLYNGYQEAGYHKINWDASATSAGLYFLEMRSGNFTRMIKMTLVK